MCEHHHKAPLRRVFLAFVLLLAALLFNLDGSAKFVFFLIAYIIAGGDVLLKAIKNILKGEVFDENFLMSIATMGAFCIKEYPEAVMVMILYQIGEFLQHGALEKSRKSIALLMDIRPDYVNIEENGTLVKKSPLDVPVGSIIIVKTGEKIPLDGIVIEGSASVDTKALTGESAPRKLKVSDDAISGFINTNGVLKICTKKEFAESTVSIILKLVEHASEKKSKSENYIKKFARYYTPVVVVCALLLAILPPIISGAGFTIWLERALTFLVISCPCALVISVPLGFFAGIGCASKNGILIKGANYIESLCRLDSVVFDKTGTLTKGTFEVVLLEPCNNTSTDDLIKYSAMAENYSSHPIALSIKEKYATDIDPTVICNVEEIAGMGVKADVCCNRILVGNEKLMRQFGIDISHKKNDKARTVVYCAKNSEFMGSIIISDRIKPDAKKAVKELKSQARQVIMLSGDSHNSAQAIAKELNIDKFYAELLPSDKVTELEKLIADKRKNTNVIFVGDGINDAPVLRRSDIGIAMGAMGSDAAIEAADIVIMDDMPSKVALAINIAQKTMRIVKQNITFAIGIKILFLLLGAFGYITMWSAVFADVGVSLIAILNSLRAMHIKNSKT